MLTYAHAAIVKHTRDPENGDLIVTGRATSDDLDLDQQICDPDWLEKAMPEWFKIGNVREQHSHIAAGVGTELAQIGNAWNLTARVTDPVSAHKVETGTLKGFSVGIRNARVITDKAAPGGRIASGDIVEISLVDRPANPTCMLTLAKSIKPGMEILAKSFDAERRLVKVEELREIVPDVDDITAKATTPEPLVDAAKLAAEVEREAVQKMVISVTGADNAALADAITGLVRKGQLAIGKRDFTADQRQAAADSGDALPDGSYPIKSVGDLKNAIQAYGRAKDPAAVKAHIERRAKALGRTDLLPDAWSKAAEPGMWAHDPAAIALVRNGLVALINAELAQLCEGGDSLEDVYELLASVSMLMSWWSDEARQGEAPTPYPARVADPAAGVINRMEAPVTIPVSAAPAAVAPAAAPAAVAAAVPAPAATAPPAAPAATETPAAAPAVADPSPAPVKAAEGEQPPAAPAAAVEQPPAQTTPAPVDKTVAPENPTTGLTPELVKSLIAEAVAPLIASNEATKAELAKALAQPSTGAPVMARTTAMVEKSGAREKHLADAANYKRLAGEVNDQVARDGYLAKAAAADKAAAAI